MNMPPNTSNAYDAVLKKVLYNSGFSTLSQLQSFSPIGAVGQNDEQIDIAWKNWLKTYITNRFQGIVAPNLILKNKKLSSALFQA